VTGPLKGRLKGSLTGMGNLAIRKNNCKTRMGSKAFGGEGVSAGLRIAAGSLLSVLWVEAFFPCVLFCVLGLRGNTYLRAMVRNPMEVKLK
jgi:hypothetical protein